MVFLRYVFEWFHNTSLFPSRCCSCLQLGFTELLDKIFFKVKTLPVKNLTQHMKKLASTHSRSFAIVTLLFQSIFTCLPAFMIVPRQTLSTQSILRHIYILGKPQWALSYTHHISPTKLYANCREKNHIFLAYSCRSSVQSLYIVKSNPRRA